MGLIEKILDNAIAAGATDVHLFEIIPDGTRVKVVKFGGYERVTIVATGLIILQWGSNAGGWETIRAGGGPSPFEFLVNREFVGNGVKRFRIVRQNKDLLGSKEMAAWAEVYVA